MSCEVVVFIHGFRKQHDDWDITAHGKSIDIANKIARSYSVVCVQLDDEDYCQSTVDIAKEMCESLRKIVQEKQITIVAHSNGAFYAMQLAKIDPRQFGHLLLIDPTIKCESYRRELVEKSATDLVAARKLDNFDDLPTNVPNKVVVRIHFNYTEKTSFDHVKGLHDLTKNNIKSRLITHCNVSHMIHYKLPQTIIDSILEICRC